MLKELMTKGVDAVLARIPTSSKAAEAVDSLDARVSALIEENQRLTRECETLKRKASEYFSVIEDIEKQRNQWKDMWFAHGREHLNAQAKMESTIEVLRNEVLALIKIINGYRTEKGQPEMNRPAEASRASIVEAFARSLKKAYELAPKEIQGEAERAALASPS
jgi:regulator of replication initiation timing